MPASSLSGGKRLEKLGYVITVDMRIPSVQGWEVQVVCESCDMLDGYNPKSIEPNLEHAYVHFLETSAEGLNLQDQQLSA